MGIGAVIVIVVGALAMAGGTATVILRERAMDRANFSASTPQALRHFFNPYAHDWTILAGIATFLIGVVLIAIALP
ncbi:hypothetical protein [Leifsonia sp. C5G2]|uniref:hypothetical protein n=1 Tax=Leifsonia sp. C5G2 TaxID=2735269 RepID=UPI001584E611|nr:hypothetical protein [Leifsonia sp. C5G2]NUU08043.1 hypothetical protein [Leifsonia sp. C5G2]